MNARRVSKPWYLVLAVLLMLQAACVKPSTPPAPTRTLSPTSTPAFLSIQAVSEPGIRFVAPEAGLYRFTVDSGALQNCPPGAVPNDPRCNTWSTYLLVYKNRPAIWSPNPVQWDYTIGVDSHSASASAAGSLGVGKFTDIPLAKGDTLILVVDDCTTCYSDNRGELRLRVERLVD